ncbi:MAG TPA: hypothetical protein VFI41_05210 [Gemmatimonadales bacterium]|nr:hypothetical protein [Gemmatimonadales bacterium]
MARRQVIKCDICYVRMPPDMVWTYEIVPFSMRGEPGQRDYQDDGAWALCPDCHQAVQAQRFEDVFARSFAIDPPTNAAEERWKRRIIGLFLLAADETKIRRPPYRGLPYFFTDGETQHG